MTYKKDDGQLFVSLVPGDDVIASLQEVVETESISSGLVTGIGAVTDVVLGYYDLEKREYIRKSFEGSYELISLNGNISYKDDQIFIHPHVALSGEDFSVIGGHLFDATVSAAGEFIIFPGTLSIYRKLVPEINLPLWHFKD